MNEFEAWLRTLPVWLQKAQSIYSQRGTILDEDLQELVIICKQEAEHVNSPARLQSDLEEAPSPAVGHNLRLTTLSEIKGINRLAPKKPLDLGEENLVVVYGPNGSGKSGYARMLKHVCGARQPGYLLPNAYEDSPTVGQGCHVVYEIDGRGRPVDWIAQDGPLDELRSVDIFDTSAVKIYVDGECSVTYLPVELQIIESLTNVCQRVQSILEGEMSLLTPRRPDLPLHLASTEPGIWYKGISASTSVADIYTHCTWSEENQAEYDSLGRRLLEQYPLESAKDIRTQEAHLRKLISDTREIIDQLSDEKVLRIVTLRQTVEATQTASQVAAGTAFDELELPGVGGKAWKELWFHARNYSQQVAYPGGEFPNVGEGALCVLCQQPLEEAAKHRLEKFEQFISDSLESKLKQSREDLRLALELVSDPPSDDNLRKSLDVCSLKDDALRQGCVELYLTLKQRSADVVAGNFPCVSLPESDGLLRKLSELATTRGGQADQLESDISIDARELNENLRLKLEARRCIAQNRRKIEEDVALLKVKAKLASAKQLASTTVLSKKASQLADALITESFAERFLNEVKQLGGKRIPVKIIKIRATKGQILHRVMLVGATRSPNVVLSEGEQRVVSLAAFLADVLGKEHPAPFIFDDPVSSLDQDYEEAVAGRLTELAKERQVIVFTHRLSLVALIREAAKAKSAPLKIIQLRQEAWGAGEPDYSFNKKPGEMIEHLRNIRVKSAERVLNEQGKAPYNDVAQGICSEVRMLVEKMIEQLLLNEVVARFRRSVITKDKLAKLALIRQDDCAFFHEMMTKYSRYEHSQSEEAPVDLPFPDELEDDLRELQEWQKSWKTRT